MASCPVCGWEIGWGDLRRERFTCPGCKERLRLEESDTDILVVGGSAMLALLISYVAGVQGYDYLWSSVILYFVICGVCGALRGLLFPRKVERDPSTNDGKILHLTGPSDSSKKS